jgi:hypothetical protein
MGYTDGARAIARGIWVTGRSGGRRGRRRLITCGVGRLGGLKLRTAVGAWRGAEEPFAYPAGRTAPTIERC